MKSTLSFDYPVIAAVRDLDLLPLALSSKKIDTIFMMCGELSNLNYIVDKIQNSGKRIFLHIDLIKGLASDKESIDFLVKKVNPTGIVTTKNNLIKIAKNSGLVAIQHLFIIDTQALQVGIRNVKANQPDAVEIMPGLMPRIIREFTDEVNLPLVVGGLLKEKSEINDILLAGANAAISGSPLVWDIDIRIGRKCEVEEQAI